MNLLTPLFIQLQLFHDLKRILGFIPVDSKRSEIWVLFSWFISVTYSTPLSHRLSRVIYFPLTCVRPEHPIQREMQPDWFHIFTNHLLSTKEKANPHFQRAIPLRQIFRHETLRNGKNTEFNVLFLTQSKPYSAI